VDNFSTDVHPLHALVVLKGDCAQTSGQLPDECPDPVGLRESGGSQRAVFGALVAFQEVVFRPGPNPPVIAIGGIVINPNPAPIIMRRRVALFCRINLGSIFASIAVRRAEHKALSRFKAVPPLETALCHSSCKRSPRLIRRPAMRRST